VIATRHWRIAAFPVIALFLVWYYQPLEPGGGVGIANDESHFCWALMKRRIFTPRADKGFACGVSTHRTRKIIILQLLNILLTCRGELSSQLLHWRLLSTAYLLLLKKSPGSRSNNNQSWVLVSTWTPISMELQQLPPRILLFLFLVSAVFIRCLLVKSCMAVIKACKCSSKPGRMTKSFLAVSILSSIMIERFHHQGWRYA
jgi:hypothetical protein